MPNTRTGKASASTKPARPLYTTEDAIGALALMEPVEYGQWLDLATGVRARFLNAGHILGAAMVEVHLEMGERTMRIVFSGDVGRYNVPLHSDPDPLPDCHFLVMESTYGDREHKSSSMEDQIRDALIECLDRKGTALIPSFAVGRSQLVTLCLRQLIRAGRLPDVPIHIDSPMAVDATRIYSRHIQDLSLDESLTADGRSRLFPNNVKFHKSVAESKQLNRLPRPRIVISSSGNAHRGTGIASLEEAASGQAQLDHARRLSSSQHARPRDDGKEKDRARARAEHSCGSTVHLHQRALRPRGPERASALGPLGRRKPRTAGHDLRHPWRTEILSALATLLQNKLGSRTFTPQLGQSFDLGELLEH